MEAQMAVTGAGRSVQQNSMAVDAMGVFSNGEAVQQASRRRYTAGGTEIDDADEEYTTDVANDDVLCAADFVDDTIPAEAFTAVAASATTNRVRKKKPPEKIISKFHVVNNSSLQDGNTPSPLTGGMVNHTDTILMALRSVTTSLQRSNAKETADRKARTREENRGKVTVDGMAYCHHMTKEQLQAWIIGINYITVDPGKRDIIYAMHKDGRVFRFSNKEYLHISQRLKLTKKVQKLTKKRYGPALAAIVNKNANSVSAAAYLEYMKEVNAVDASLMSEYVKTQHRRLLLLLHSKRQKADDALINKIRAAFGRDVVIFYGDMSKTESNRGMVSTPGARIRRLVDKHFKVFMVNEYNTSKMHHETEKECGCMYTYKAKVIRKIFAVRTFTR